MRADLIWLILGAILIIAEMVTPSFFLIWFGIGGLIAAAAAYLHASATIQWIVFLASSAALVLCSRLFARKVTPGPPPSRQNVDEYLGETGVVVQKDPHANTGVIRVKREAWRADSSEVLEEGALVEVVGSEGVHLKVRRKPA